MVLKYFRPEEFSRCTPACDIAECNEDALLMLDRLREYVGLPLILNSAYRSPSHEKKHGRTGQSSHCKGIAFDIRCFDDKLRALIVFNAPRVGFTRVGIHLKYVHVDCDTSKLNPCIWLYK